MCYVASQLCAPASVSRVVVQEARPPICVPCDISESGSASMDEEGMMTRSSWAPGHMRWLLNRVCHTGGLSAWDSASSANLGSRCVGLKGSAILQERPSFKPSVALLPTASCTSHSGVMPGRWPQSTCMRRVWGMLLTDGPFLVQVASTQVRSRAEHCSMWLFQSFVACIVQSLEGPGLR